MLDINNPNEGIMRVYAVVGKMNIQIFKDDEKKSEYITSLLECENDDVCLIAYCVNEQTAYVLAKGVSNKALDNYIKAVNNYFYSTYAPQNGFPFMPMLSSRKIKNEYLLNAISTLHEQSNIDPAENKYCSYSYLAEGKTDAVAIIQSITPIANRSEFEEALQSAVKEKMPSVVGRENFDIVMEQDKNRYLSSGIIDENNVIFVISDVCLRTSKSYNYVMRKMGLKPKKRRDLMTGVICDIIIRNSYSVMEAIAALKLKKESYYQVVLEVIAELNRVYKYSYDYITNLIGISDMNYDILTELIKGIMAQFGEEFETVCVKLHLQNDLAKLRKRCLV